ncbi:electron transfer flavoprotein subunit beta/FixA family protein [Corynebacterium tapiri]|uniref:Electron transfer flavoprotein subunit beta n=1 Tax=Corynebacterium tapiri TaxID=1448266 RepID=A0A5C4U658_9CORY|nr:electron transfer flavoprotein subunit beta/FixA family protein [Corynebacterium tapiri]TNL99753.1 electron transfer flavoprotein subunit beta/FixA family protein [Corynebacterium tapiri]
MSAIVVLVKHVPDTWSTKSLESDHTLDRDNTDSIIDEVNEYAVEQALRLKEADDSLTVIAATMGPGAADEALRKALAMGADDAVRLTDDALAGSDAIATAWALNALVNSIADVELIITGSASSDGETGVMAGLLSEYRQIPALTAVNELSKQGSTLTATRIDAHGTYTLEASTPAIVSVTDKADKPRYPNFKKMKAAKAHEITVHDAASLGLDTAHVGLAASATRVNSVAKKPARSAGEVINGTNPQEAAEKIADFLSARGLI